MSKQNNNKESNKESNNKQVVTSLVVAHMLFNCVQGPYKKHVEQIDTKFPVVVIVVVVVVVVIEERARLKPMMSQSKSSQMT